MDDTNNMTGKPIAGLTEAEKSALAAENHKAAETAGQNAPDPASVPGEGAGADAAKAASDVTLNMRNENEDVSRKRANEAIAENPGLGPQPGASIEAAKAEAAATSMGDTTGGRVPPFNDPTGARHVGDNPGDAPLGGAQIPGTAPFAMQAQAAQANDPDRDALGLHHPDDPRSQVHVAETIQRPADFGVAGAGDPQRARFGEPEHFAADPAPRMQPTGEQMHETEQQEKQRLADELQEKVEEDNAERDALSKEEKIALLQHEIATITNVPTTGDGRSMLKPDTARADKLRKELAELQGESDKEKAEA